MNTYKGISYLIKQNPHMFFPLAYVRIPDDHPWQKIDNYDDLPVEVHGGVTYMTDFMDEKQVKNTWQRFTPGKWFGWDYGHAGDWDYYVIDESPARWNERMNNKFWQFDEVDEEVKSAIDQMLKVEA